MSVDLILLKFKFNMVKKKSSLISTALYPSVYSFVLYVIVLNCITVYNVLFSMQVPPTGFQCNGRVEGGYYADPAAECQVKAQHKETVS